MNLNFFWTSSTPLGALESLNGQHTYILTSANVQRFDIDEDGCEHVSYPSPFTSILIIERLCALMSSRFHFFFRSKRGCSRVVGLPNV